MVQIYAFTNTQTRKAYIGCTAGKLAKRAREHKCLLRAGRHTCKALQAAWNATPDSFEIVLLEAAPTDRREAELRWMDAYGANLLNEHKVSFAPIPEAIQKGVAARAAQLRGSTQTTESNEKRRLAQLGKPKGHGAKISATKRAKAAMR